MDVPQLPGTVSFLEFPVREKSETGAGVARSGFLLLSLVKPSPVVAPADAETIFR